MKGFLLPLYCFTILGAQLCGAEGNDDTTNQTSVPNMTSTWPTMTDKGASSLSISSLRPSSPGPFTTSSTSTRTPPVNNGLHEFLFKAECRRVALAAGGLILACAILLISTLTLACKVCRLSRRLKMLNSSFDPISSSDNCAVTAQSCTAKKDSDPAEAGETIVLMSDMGRTQGDVANGATKDEEGGQVEEEEPTAENKKEEGGASAGESKKETPAAVAEGSPASQPQQDISSSQAGVASASSSEGAEEPKDVV